MSDDVFELMMMINIQILVFNKRIKNNNIIDNNYKSY